MNLGRPSIGLYTEGQLLHLLEAWEVPEQYLPKKAPDQLLLSLHPATGLKQASITAAGQSPFGDKRYQVVVWPLKRQLVHTDKSTEFSYVARPTNNLNGMMSDWVADIYRGDDYVGTTLPNHRREGVHYVAAYFVEQLLADEQRQNTTWERYPYHLFDSVNKDWYYVGGVKSLENVRLVQALVADRGIDREYIAW